MLRCKGPYLSSLGEFQAGEVIDEPHLCELLLRDAPEMFEVVEDDQDERAVEDAPNRMVTKATPKARTRSTTRSRKAT